MDNTWEELDTDFKSYTDLPRIKGRYVCCPGLKGTSKDLFSGYLMKLDPDATLLKWYSPSETSRHKTHKQYVAKSKTIAHAAKPTTFQAKTKWEDWIPSFLNLLRSIPGRDGVLLSYIYHDNDALDPTPHTTSSLPNIPAHTLLTQVLPCLKRANNVYKARELKITMAHADDKFAGLPAPLLPSITSA